MDAALLDKIAAWLAPRLCAHDVAEAIPEADAYRTWWRPTPDDPRWSELLALLSGADDLLTLLAVVERARELSGEPLPPAAQRSLAAAVTRHARRRRETARDGCYDLFISYAHEDTVVADRILCALADAGRRVFRDVDCIAPGESIADMIHGAMTSATGAIVLVSRAYVASPWAGRELEALVKRRLAGELILYPILIDDVPLPAELEDTYTVDLRGVDELTTDPAAAVRLSRLVRALRR